MDDTTTYADEHECGQLRIAVPGEQVSLLPLPDKEIPTSDEPQAVDVEQLARDHLTIEIRTVNRAGAVLASRKFAGKGDDVEECGSLANAEVAATQYENEQKWDSARESRGWIVDRIYS